MLQNSSDLYNGNIARMVTTITDPDSRAVLPLGNAYRYDQLNRLKHAVSFDQLNGNAWAGGAPAKYENSFTYDANGNILTQTRNDDNNQVIDELAYFYPQNAANKTVRNRLLYVSDNVDYDALDIDPGMAINNYSYDAEGRLIQDLQEEIASIEWRVDGKVKRINRIANSTKQNLSFDYDAMGHRIAKHVYTSANVLEKSTYYVLDAQGNTMATYERAVDENTLQISYAQTEKFIYGSERLGVQNVNIGLLGSQNNSYSQSTVPHRIGKKGYELSNHLGNVLSVISDKVIPHNNGGGVVDYFLADIRQAQDYSPFGVTLKGRNLKKTGLAEEFRFGYNGMEADDEMKDEGNSYTTEFRQLDTRLGKWLSLDPLITKYPNMSPYCTFNNNPIYFSDPTGLEGEPNEGDTKVEGENQMVYTGAGEGLGWKNSKDVVNFQSSDGKSIFVRGGESNSYNYQKINNIVISIGGGYGDLSIGEGSVQLGVSNTWMIFSKDIESAQKKYKEKFGDLKIGTLVIDTHGGTGVDRTGSNPMSIITTSSTDGTYVSRYGIDEAAAGKKLSVTQMEYNDAAAFNSLVTNISPGGSLILAGCTVGSDKLFLQEIGYLSSKKISIYANLDKTTCTLTTDSFSITTEMNNYQHGWVRMGVINQNSVESEGAKPKYRYQYLKTETEKGIMQFSF